VYDDGYQMTRVPSRGRGNGYHPTSRPRTPTWGDVHTDHTDRDTLYRSFTSGAFGSWTGVPAVLVSALGPSAGYLLAILACRAQSPQHGDQAGRWVKRDDDGTAKRPKGKKR
jgi:hypothetical protein